MTSGFRVKSIVRVSFYNYTLSNLFLDLTEPVDIYSEWIDAADSAQKDTRETHVRRPVASSSRPATAPASVGSDEE